MSDEQTDDLTLFLSISLSLPLSLVERDVSAPYKVHLLVNVLYTCLPIRVDACDYTYMRLCVCIIFVCKTVFSVLCARDQLCYCG